MYIICKHHGWLCRGNPRKRTHHHFFYSFITFSALSYLLLQTLLMATTDRNCRQIRHKFQLQGGGGHPFNSCSYFLGPFRVLRPNSRPMAHTWSEPHTAPYSPLWNPIYGTLYTVYHGRGPLICLCIQPFSIVINDSYTESNNKK